MWEARHFKTCNDFEVLGRSDNVEDLKARARERGGKTIYYWTGDIPESGSRTVEIFDEIVRVNDGQVHVIPFEIEVKTVGKPRANGCLNNCYCVISSSSSWAGCQAFQSWFGYTTITSCGGAKKCLVP